MSLNTFKLALRSIQANKLVVGVSVLAIGLGALSAALLGTYLYFELTTDRFHKNYDQIYMLAVGHSPESKWEGVLMLDFSQTSTTAPVQTNVTTPTGLLAKTQMVSRYNKGELTMDVDSVSMTPTTLVTDTSFFQVFDFTLLTDSLDALKHGETGVFLSKRYAMEQLGTTDVIGKPLTVSGQANLNTTVKGILKDPPPNSSIQFDAIVVGDIFVLSYAFPRGGMEYMVLDDSFDKQGYLKDVDTRMKHSQQLKGAKAALIPLKGLYFSGRQFETGAVSRQGNKRDLYVIGLVLLVLLLVTGLTVWNLQHLMTRSMLKMDGMLRLLGATTHEITRVYLTSSCMMASLSWVLSVLLFVLSKPFLTQMTGLDLSAMSVSVLVDSLLVVVLFVGLMGGLSRIELKRKPMLAALKGDRMKKLNVLNRNVSLTFQFALTMVLIFSSIVVFKQWSYMTHANVGWHYQEVVRTRFYTKPIQMLDPKFAEKMQEKEMLENELRANPSIQSFSKGASPFEHSYEMPWMVKGSGMELNTVTTLSVSSGTLKNLSLTLLEGHFFEKDWTPKVVMNETPNGASMSELGWAPEVVINEAAKKQWHIQSIDSCRLMNPYWSSFYEECQVIGVVKDFNYERLALPVKPMVMICMDNPGNQYLVRFTKGREKEGLAFLQMLHDRYIPDEPFEYTFLEDEAKALYEKEKNLGLMFGVLTTVSLLIALSGLFALTYYDCQRRVKEIGIRKANGATILQTVWLLNRDLMIYLGLAFVLASSAGYIFMQQWLEQFAKHIPLSWWLFALTGLIAFAVVLLTVTGLSWKAATKNPVESLRYE